MMDCIIEVRAWGLGYDESEELTAAIADVCAERGLALKDNRDEELVRCIVSLKPQGGRLDAGEAGKVAAVIGSAAQGAQLLIVPSESGSLVDRPTVGL